jgi:16S rRNA (cytosine967-C5)-methyltransferase
VSARRPRGPAGPRDVALAALVRADQGAWVNLLLPSLLRSSELDERGRAAVTDLVNSTTRVAGTLDAELARRSRQPLRRLEPLVRAGLRLGAYELLYAGTPADAAVGEAVGAVRRAGGPGPAGYVNAVLRRLAERPPRWPEPRANPLAWATGPGAHPEWIAREALARLGPEGLVALVEVDNRAPAVTLRATPGAATADELVAELAAAGVTATRTRLSPECVSLAGGDPGKLAAVAEGRAVVQDEGSALVAPALGAAPGELVVDLAAGPGGKTGHLAALGARVLAVELHPTRAALVAETAGRIGVAERVGVVVADATRAPLAPGRASAVLIDAPCTNLGSLRRRPEARWRHSPDELDELTRLQGRMLDTAAVAVRPGGSVLYSVCTWTRAETDEVVAAARARLPQLRPAALGGQFGDATTRQLWPHTDGTDGIYLARFTRAG